jgi:hypothetical protein
MKRITFLAIILSSAITACSPAIRPQGEVVLKKEKSPAFAYFESGLLPPVRK